MGSCDAQRSSQLRRKLARLARKRSYLIHSNADLDLLKPRHNKRWADQWLENSVINGEELACVLHALAQPKNCARSEFAVCSSLKALGLTLRKFGCGAPVTFVQEAQQLSCSPYTTCGV
jgi:hypothetical protein